MEDWSFPFCRSVAAKSEASDRIAKSNIWFPQQKGKYTKMSLADERFQDTWDVNFKINFQEIS